MQGAECRVYAARARAQRAARVVGCRFVGLVVWWFGGLFGLLVCLLVCLVCLVCRFVGLFGLFGLFAHSFF